MNPEQRLQLNELIRANNSVDNTSLIRELKHSTLIWDDVKKIILLKKGKEWTEVESECIQQANFLYTNYIYQYNILLLGCHLYFLKTSRTQKSQKCA